MADNSGDIKYGNLTIMNSSEENQDFEPLQKTTKPLLLVMKVFGLYHDPSIQSRILPELSPTAVKRVKKHTASAYILTAYSGLVTLFLLLNILRYIPAFFVGHQYTSNHELTVFRVILAGWYFNCFLNTAILFYACHKNGRLNGFFGYYNKISTDEIARKLKTQTNCANFRRKVLLNSLVAVGLVLLNVVGSLYIAFMDLEGGSATVATNPFPIHFTTLAIVSIVTVYCSAAWSIPVVFVTTLASVLRYQLGIVTYRIRDLMHTKEKCVIKKLNDFRIKHLHYTNAIDLLDRDFQYLFAASYVCSIWICCFTLYQLVNTKDLPTGSAIMYGVWLSCNLLIVLIISISAARVTDQVCNTCMPLFLVAVILPIFVNCSYLASDENLG